MKLLRSAVVLLAVAVVVTSLAGSLLAAEGMHHKDWQKICQEKITALKDSAAILQKTNPDLAKGLTDLASMKEKKLQEMTDMKANHEAKEKMLRDSAAILQKSNPDFLWLIRLKKSLMLRLQRRRNFASRYLNQPLRANW